MAPGAEISNPVEVPRREIVRMFNSSLDSIVPLTVQIFSTTIPMIFYNI
jgi:hypothetical protein